jgi:hypothetical protein
MWMMCPNDRLREMLNHPASWLNRGQGTGDVAAATPGGLLWIAADDEVSKN